MGSSDPGHRPTSWILGLKIETWGTPLALCGLGQMIQPPPTTSSPS